MATDLVATMEMPTANMAPVGADADMNQELAKAWKKVQSRLKKMAELQPGTTYEDNITEEDVMGNLDNILKGFKKPSRSQGIKDTVSATLTVVGKVGNMAASAASQVFAPAGECYNALNFVITAWQDYESAFETLQALFEQCNKFLNRLPEYYKAKMNANLSRVACDVLDVFVEVCDQALAIRQKRFRKFKIFMKIAFISQDDFQVLKAKLDELTQEEQLNAVAQTLVYSAQTYDHTSKLVENMEDRKLDQMEKEREKEDDQALIGALDFNKSSQTWDGNAGAPIETWKDQYRSIRNHFVPGTGDWLSENDQFNNWVRRSGKNPILAMVGDGSSGKSYLISAAISHLRSSASSNSDKSRRLVAFHYIDNRKPNAGVHAVGRSLVWQFAAADASYKQSVATTCGKYPIDPKAILSRLLLDNNEELEKMDAVFYIVINKLGSRNHNVDQSLITFLQRVSRSKSCQIRVLFSATEGTMKKLLSNNIDCPTIQINRNNDSDVDKFITARMDRMPVLADSARPEVAEIRDTIRDELRRQTHGNYDMINATLDKIRPLESSQEIKDALKGAGRRMSEHITDSINNLNDTRTPKEIEEMNEIILWLSSAKEALSVELMTSALHAKNKSASLRPLQDRFRDRFILFRVNDHGHVSFRSENVLNQIPERNQRDEDLENNTKVVNKKEVDIVRHFLSNVCPPDLMEKLEMERHFHEKLYRASGKDHICREDDNTSNFLIAQACVDVLANMPEAGLAPLRKYAVDHIMDHLSDVDKARVDSAAKVTFGTNLAHVFRNPQSIKNLLLATDQSTPTLPRFLEDKDLSEKLLSWLKDRTVLSAVGSKHSQYGLDIHDMNVAKTLIQPCIRQMAVFCFRRESNAHVTCVAFAAVEKFCKDMGHDDIQAWSQAQLGVKPDALWHTQMAMVLRSRDQKTQARDECTKALELDRDNWRPLLLMAKLHPSEPEAIDILERLTKRFKEDSELRKDNRTRADIAFNLGNRHWAQKQPEMAVAAYTESVRRDPVASGHVQAILQKYYWDERWADMADLIQQLVKDETSPLTSIIESMWDEPPFHAKLKRVLNKNMTKAGIPEMRDNIDKAYETAITHARSHKNHKQAYYLGHHHANLLSMTMHPQPTEKIRIVLESSVRDLPQTNLPDLPKAFFLVGYRLGTIYLSYAQAAFSSSSSLSSSTAANSATNNTREQEETPEKWLTALETITPEAISPDQMRLPLSLFAARYHITRGDLAKARSLAHNTLRMAVELLSDDDDGNDILAYRKIMYGMIPFGDTKNAAAALAMMHACKVKQNRDAGGTRGLYEVYCRCGEDCGAKWVGDISEFLKGGKKKKKKEEEGEGGARGQEDNQDLEKNQNLWWCRDCINIVLRGKCLKNLRERKGGGGGASNVCHADHEHMEVPEWDIGLMMKMTKAQVPYDGELVSKEQWLGKITDKYHLGKEEEGGGYESGSQDENPRLLGSLRKEVDGSFLVEG